MELELFVAILFVALLAVGIGMKVKETFLEYKTKCFDCEKQFPVEWAWMGQPTKCFDCESELVRRTGIPSMGFEAHPI